MTEDAQAEAERIVKHVSIIAGESGGVVPDGSDNDLIAVLAAAIAVVDDVEMWVEDDDALDRLRERVAALRLVRRRHERRCDG